MKYKLSEIMDLIGGGTPKTSIPEYWGGPIPWLSVKDFNNDYRYVYKTEKTITEEGLKNSSTKLLQRDDSIISARGTVGEMAMIPFPMAFNQSWTNHHLQKFAAIAADMATTMGHIKREELAKAEVLIPSQSDYDRIGGLLAPLYDLVIANRIENRKLASLRDELLPQLMSGQLDVSEVSL